MKKCICYLSPSVEEKMLNNRRLKCSILIVGQIETLSTRNQFRLNCSIRSMIFTISSRNNYAEPSPPDAGCQLKIGLFRDLLQKRTDSFGNHNYQTFNILLLFMNWQHCLSTYQLILISEI